MRVDVRVMPKAGILDPQGKAIAQALGRLGFATVGEVRAGKLFQLDIGTEDAAAAREAASRMAETLLSNPVIEDFEVEVAP